MTALDKFTGVTISDLSYAYRNSLLSARSNKVLDKIHLTLAPGEITYILGPNGSGKSTLVNCITGMLPNYNGEIKFPTERKMGALLDDPFVYTSLKVKENIKIFLRYQKIEYGAYHELLDEYLEVNELLEQRYKKLSQGQRQRVLLFLAMINNPDILLLDEPFNGLDPFYSEKLIALLLRLKEEDRIILINDHIISHTMRLADQIVFLIRHKIVWTMQAEALEKGLFYKSEGHDMETRTTISFANQIKMEPHDGDMVSLPIKDLTELYTLAVNHGRTKVI